VVSHVEQQRREPEQGFQGGPRAQPRPPLTEPERASELGVSLCMPSLQRMNRGRGCVGKGYLRHMAEIAVIRQALSGAR
jgi:hypothetical protein